MTTAVTILNHGPAKIRVTPIDDDGKPVAPASPLIEPQQFITEKYVWAGRSFKIEEVA